MPVVGDRGGAHAVRGHLGGRELDRQRLDQSDQPELRRGVRLDPRVSALTGRRRDRDDPAATARRQGRRRGLGDEERALEVDVERAVPIELGDIGERLDVGHPGGDDQGIEAAELAFGIRDDPADVGRVGHIEEHRKQARIRHGLLLELLGGNVGDHDASTQIAQALGDSEAEARRTASDEHLPTGNHRHLSPFLSRRGSAQEGVPARADVRRNGGEPAGSAPRGRQDIAAPRQLLGPTVSGPLPGACCFGRSCPAERWSRLSPGAPRVGQRYA